MYNNVIIIKRISLRVDNKAIKKIENTPRVTAHTFVWVRKYLNQLS